MSKRKKAGQIPVEVIEVKSKNENETILEVRIQEDVAGTVTQIEGEQAIVVFKSGRQHPYPTMDQGIEEVLREYNLHNL